MLVNMLGLHPKLSPIYETDFIYELLKIYFYEPELSAEKKSSRFIRFLIDWSKNIGNFPDIKNKNEKYPIGFHRFAMDQKELLELTKKFLLKFESLGSVKSIRWYLDKVFQYHIKTDKAEFWLNKSPRYISVVDSLDIIFPEMKFINCIRDGRGVLNSVKKVMGKTYNPEIIAKWWITALIRAEKFSEKCPEKIVNVYFEKMVEGNPGFLAEIIAFLGIKDCSGEIYRKLSDEYSIVFSKSRRRTWEKELPAEDIKVFESVAGEMLEKYGYS